MSKLHQLEILYIHNMNMFHPLTLLKMLSESLQQEHNLCPC